MHAFGKLEAACVKGAPAVDKDREFAEKTAGEFEAMFVRQLVGSLRQTAGGLGGDDGGMFGSGPGADTYADWFDQNVADSVCADRGIGIKERILTDMERWHQIGKRQALDDVADKLHRATASLDLKKIAAGSAAAKNGGIDVVR